MAEAEGAEGEAAAGLSKRRKGVVRARMQDQEAADDGPRGRGEELLEALAKTSRAIRSFAGLLFLPFFEGLSAELRRREGADRGQREKKRRHRVLLPRC